MRTSKVLMLVVSAYLGACANMHTYSPPDLDILKLKESFSLYEGKRVVVHGCTYMDPHGAVAVVSCDPRLTANHIATFMTVDRSDKASLAEYQRLFRVLGPAYRMSITAVPRLAPHGHWHILEFESAAKVAQVDACELWLTDESCN